MARAFPARRPPTLDAARLCDQVSPLSQPLVAFAGLTHLALNSAVVMAEKGFDVICFDPVAERVKQLTAGEAPFSEPDFDRLLQENQERIRFTAEPQSLAGCALCYLAPDIPTDDRGRSDLSGLDALIARVQPELAEDCVLVVLSQVPPGYTRKIERARSRLFYQVETLIFGRAIERARHPERYIVGCADPDQELPEAFRVVLEAYGCPILPMRYESAELAKLSINLCLVASVSAANTLAELCEQVGADWSEIVPALRLDRRIGQHAYIEAGLGIAGGNLERDLETVVRLGGALGTDTRVVRAWQDNSRYRKQWVLRLLHRELLWAVEQPVIAVLGLAYKAGTNSVKNSPSLALLSSLAPYPLRVYDPVVSAAAAWHPRLTQSATAAEASDGAQALAIMTPWPEFRDLEPGDLAARMAGKLVIDPFGTLDERAVQAAGLIHRRLGRSC